MRLVDCVKPRRETVVIHDGKVEAEARRRLRRGRDSKPEQLADALKARDELRDKVKLAHVLLDEPQEDGEQLLGLVAAQLTRRVAQHKQLPTRDDAAELGVARVEEVGGGKARVRVQDAGEGAGDDRRRRGAEGRVREARRAQEETDPAVSRVNSYAEHTDAPIKADVCVGMDARQ